MTTNKNQSGYNCPFIELDCLHIDSLSMRKTVICNHCEIYIREKNMQNDVKVPDPGFQIIRLYN